MTQFDLYHKWLDQTKEKSMEPLAVIYVKCAVLSRLEQEVTELKSKRYRVGSFHPIYNPKMQRLEYIQVMEKEE